MLLRPSVSWLNVATQLSDANVSYMVARPDGVGIIRPLANFGLMSQLGSKQSGTALMISTHHMDFLSRLRTTPCAAGIKIFSCGRIQLS